MSVYIPTDVRVSVALELLADQITHTEQHYPDSFIIIFYFIFFIYLFSLTGTLYINKNIPVNVPELAKGYFSSVVPGQDVTSHPKENVINNT